MCRSLTNGLGWTATVIACLALAAVAFSGCAHCSKPNKEPPCVSSCGMLLEDKGNGSMSCTDLDEAEEAVLNALDELKDKDPRFTKKYACGQLFGWQLQLAQHVVESDSSIGGGMLYVGVSHCDMKVMRLMANKDWRSGSYPHEIAHAIQECNPLPEWRKGTGGGGHEGWEENGVYSIIKDFREGRR